MTRRTWKARVVTPDGTEQQLKIGVDGITVLVGPAPANDCDADKANRRAMVRTVQLNYRAAVDKVLLAVRDGSVTALALGDTNGAAVWAADVWDTDLVGHQVTVNAVSGSSSGTNRCSRKSLTC